MRAARLDQRSEAGFEGQLDELAGGEGAGTNDLTGSTLREVGGYGTRIKLCLDALAIHVNRGL